MSVRNIYMKALLVLCFMGLCSFPAVAEVKRSGTKGNPAVVFIPGLASSGALYEKWATALSATNDVYVLTLPGFAGVPAKYEENIIENTVISLALLLREDNVKQAVVVGHSMGGLMAMMLAQKSPEQVGRLVLVDSLPYLAGLFMPGVSAGTALQRASQMATYMENLPRRRFLQEQKAGLTRLTKTKEFVPKLEAWLKASDQRTVARVLKETLQTDFRPNLPNITVPVDVLVAWDDAMPFSSAQISALFATQYNALPNKRVRLVKDSRHFIMADQPEAFEQTLHAALTQQ